ncbi:hypothetical protein SAMN02745216_01272 [Desulfatibacillum alkenivorans DSM 16219]|jgi:hypothetical protein|uniref:Uncharacterized protein n=1 Tax=Desulfatibacillum alkenivorans DSM 16219 TaxID=1121393 RepID=A0A1M6HNA8_9BACT|nr:hypothetical protein [Desulfatibacillum alkenivorans]SHJ23692.1 hypothetical protein SAMN02745216_01272 [Desulfatibacillum alkenivorans DSM 16219]
MKINKPFKKMPGGGRNIFAPSYLWMANDHLLCVNTTLFYEESYRRFFFRDIQAIFIQNTVAGYAWMASYSLLVLLFGWWTVSGGVETAGFIVPLAVFSFLLARSIFSKGSCKFWIQTDSGVELLKSVNSRRRAKKILAQLRPLIEQAQGGNFAPETLGDASGRPTIDHGGLFEADRKAQNKTPGKGAPAPTQQTAPPRRQFHKPLYALFIISAGMTGLEFLFSSLLMEFCGGLIFLAIGALVIMALVRQGGGAVSSGLRTLTWISGGFALIAFGAGYITFMAVIIQNPDIGNNHWLILKTMAEMSPKENSLLFALSIFHIIGCSFLGVTGLVLANMQGSHSEKTGENSQPSTDMPVAAGEDS